MSLAPLILGLVIFLGAHSVRIFADDWRTQQIERLGENAWKGLYSLLSIAGFALMIWGYSLTRAQPVILFDPPTWTRMVASVLTLPAFILIAAAYVPGNRMKSVLGHPMILGVKVWALAHLIANGRLGDVVLFGAFLVWAVLDFRAARRRDRASQTRYAAASTGRDVATIAVGLVAWWIFAQYLHGWLIGVRPFG